MVKEESKDLEKKEEECFTTDEEITLYLELIDLKDYIPEILLFPQKKIEKNQIKTENPEENLAEQQQPQIKILNMSAENMQNNNIECIFNLFKFNPEYI